MFAKSVGWNLMSLLKIVSINNLSAYLTKYIVKQQDGKGFECAAWHCSRGVSRLFTRSLCDVDVFNKMRGKANWMVSKETGEIFEPVVSRGAFWICVRINNKNAVLPYLEGMELINKCQLSDPGFLLHLQDWRNMFFDDDDSYNRYYVQQEIEPANVKDVGEWQDLANDFQLVDLSKN